MKVALFSDSACRRDASGRILPIRDRFPHFIAPLADRLDLLTICSRCDRSQHEGAELEPLPLGGQFQFEPLPYYASAEDFYRRLPRILPTAWRKIREVISMHDVVFLRIHNALAWPVARFAVKLSRPLVLYWAGPPIIESAMRNYPGKSIRDRAARSMARVEMRLYRRLVQRAAHNFFIDGNEYSLMGSPARTSWVVPNLVPANAVATCPTQRRPGSPLRAVFAGRLLRHKGIFDLLEAMRKLAAASVPVVLHIAGAGPEEARLRERISALGLDNVVFYEGNLSSAELKALLERCHTLVLPSYAEGAPKILWEAWAAGLAVITCPVGSVPRFVDHDRNGLLLTPGAVDELCGALERLQRDEALRLSLARSGIATAALHTWPQQIELIHAVLRSVVYGANIGDGDVPTLRLHREST